MLKCALPKNYENMQPRTKPTRLLELPDDFAGSRAVVFGLGSFGGGLAATKFLAGRGARVSISDRSSAEALAEPLLKLVDLDLERIECGGHQEATFAEADYIVVNPAIRPGHPMLEVARRSGARLISELQLFLRHCPCPVVGITGSNGKSTTSQLIHDLLAASGRRTWLGGNIGRSLLPYLPDMTASDIVVLELSSFQLHDLDQIEWSPEVGIVTNLSPNHLDWHGDLEAYKQAKQTITRWQDEECALVFDIDDPAVAEWQTQARKFGFSAHDKTALPASIPASITGAFRGTFNLAVSGTGTATGDLCERPGAESSESVRLDWDSTVLRGAHNRANIAAAVTAAQVVGCDWNAIQTGLSTFQSLPHRMQRVGTFAGRTFINDSLATTTESAIAALQSFREPVLVFSGGSDKGQNLDELVEHLVNRARIVACIGQTGPRLMEMIGVRASNSSRCLEQCEVFDNFDEAFDWVCAHSRQNEFVLLSPGFASYGWFRNFEERGATFTALAQTRSWRSESP